MITFVQFVPLHRIGEFLGRGWTISDDLAWTHHGNWSVIMVWVGDGDPS